MRVLIIDNYDSFTYNLYQDIGSLLTKKEATGVIDGFSVNVVRNDKVTLKDIEQYSPDRIIISPGPGNPEDKRYFGVCESVIRECGKRTPLLGVCLGMQGIVHTFGGKVIKAALPMHGKTSVIAHNGKGLFQNVPEALEVMRYHSLVVDYAEWPDCLEITGFVSDGSEYEEKRTGGRPPGEIMAISHKSLPIHGVQYHPESFATDAGSDLIENFLFNI